jgi:hypothetical protein
MTSVRAGNGPLPGDGMFMTALLRLPGISSLNRHIGGAAEEGGYLGNGRYGFLASCADEFIPGG